MEFGVHSFTDLSTVIDQVHALFDQWEAHVETLGGLDLATLHHTKLAVHEWLANLVQHADFGAAPRIVLALATDGANLHCTIEDNSTGFDLNAQIADRHQTLNTFPERGMGLLILQACAQKLSYAHLPDGRHRLEFTVAAEADPWLNIPF